MCRFVDRALARIRIGILLDDSCGEATAKWPPRPLATDYAPGCGTIRMYGFGDFQPCG